MIELRQLPEPREDKPRQHIYIHHTPYAPPPRTHARPRRRPRRPSGPRARPKSAPALTLRLRRHRKSLASPECPVAPEVSSRRGGGAPPGREGRRSHAVTDIGSASRCLSACLFVFVPAFMYVCLTACLPHCLPACLPVCLSIDLYLSEKKTFIVLII